MRTPISGIYRILNTTTGDFYIGSSKDITARWAQHRCSLRYGRHGNSRLQAAWVRDGAAAFCLAIVDEVGPDDLIPQEQFAIDTLCPTYNISPTAIRNSGIEMIGRAMSEATKRKISKSNTGKRRTPEEREQMRQSHLGKPAPILTAEQRERIRQALTGRKRPPDVCEKMRQSHLARGTKPPSRLGVTGEKHSPEHIAKRVATRQANKQARIRSDYHEWF